MIRPEYAELAAEFSRLAAQFGHSIDATLQRDIALLARTIECIDRHIDDIASDDARTQLWTSIVDHLEHGDSPGAVPRELTIVLRDFRDLAERRGVLARILRVVRKEIATSELLRATSSTRTYVHGVLREGHLTAALALIIAGPACGARFRRFFYRLGGPANVIDKLKDARGDRARGEILLDPGPSLHARLAIAVVVRLPRLLASHPRRLQVIRLGMRYLTRENTLIPTLGTAA